ncbi:RluA family pseudouridine synthase [Pseudoroseomonas cervicalis]|uniref:RluA family pseudouridine synthase n=1 Tax=Teichococcus cervicalis TaxID=204525 RepID=UPI0022F18171|nr:RluA family pseudouridine synthase [Pseudoroseomonas cervicalis]WBV42116.1 RluA family pseudouridine synthase [Pseudoroseomonas cervicalis]
MSARTDTSPSGESQAATGTAPEGPFTLTARPADAGNRLDRFLAAAIGTLSRSRVKALIEAGHVTRDGQKATDPSESLRPGATYVLAPPAAQPATPQAQDIPLTILFEDRHLIVLDKPAGLVVHPAPGNQDGTLVNALLAHAGEELTGIGGEKRPGIVHRLDKDTSGVMVVAKSEVAHTALSAAFASRDLERAYLALAWGVPAPASGEVDAPVGRHPTDRKRMAVVARNGKHALTRYATERAWGTSCALLRCRLATGRTHQIRVHMAHINHPLVGDPVYLRRLPATARSLPPAARDALLAFPRQALHAESLGFHHPVTGEMLRFNTPLPPDMQALIALLDGNPG